MDLRLTLMNFVRAAFGIDQKDGSPQQKGGAD